jgi:hypothetical protein
MNILATRVTRLEQSRRRGAYVRLCAIGRRARYVALLTAWATGAVRAPFLDEVPGLKADVFAIVHPDIDIC